MPIFMSKKQKIWLQHTGIISSLLYVLLCGFGRNAGQIMFSEI